MFQFLIEQIPENNRLERIWKLAQVDFKKRYYNDRFGLMWALLNPLFRVGIYYVAFNLILNRSRIGVDNFALFLFSGLIFWMTFVSTIRKGMRIYIQKKYLIENIRLNITDLYISHGISSLMGLSFNIIAFILASLFLGSNISIHAIWLIPIQTIVLLLLSVGISMILSIIYIYLRDINHFLDLIILLFFWTSGIIIPIQNIADEIPIISVLNPMIGYFENIRAVLVYNSTINLESLISVSVFSICIYTIGSILISTFAPKLYENI